MTRPSIEVLVGKTLVSLSGAHKGSGEIVFRCTDGSVYALTHHQDCCENVEVEDVVGDVEDVVGVPLLQAAEVTTLGHEEDVEKTLSYESYTWTFYRFATIKGTIAVRWLGVSNGYYSERVTFEEQIPAGLV